jgi:hypothetical protein
MVVLLAVGVGLMPRCQYVMKESPAGFPVIPPPGQPCGIEIRPPCDDGLCSWHRKLKQARP